jgi:hypothetical protein
MNKFTYNWWSCASVHAIMTPARGYISVGDASINPVDSNLHITLGWFCDGASLANAPKLMNNTKIVVGRFHVRDVLDYQMPGAAI